MRSFRRVRKIAKSDYYLRHACLSFRMEQLGSHWADFYEIWVFFWKSVEEIQVSLKTDKYNGNFTWKSMYLYDNVAQFLKWEMFQTKVEEEIKTHILCSINVFRKTYRLWDNVEKYGAARQDMHGHCMEANLGYRDTQNILVYSNTVFPRQNICF